MPSDKRGTTRPDGIGVLHPGRLGFLLILAVAVCAVVIVLGPRSIKTYWARLHNLEYIEELDLDYRFDVQPERIADLQAIWRALCDYRDQVGRFPTSREEWESLNPNVPDLLAAPTYTGSSYEVFFNLLNVEGKYLVVHDPGLEYPSSHAPPMQEGSLWHREGEFQRGLFNDGTIHIYYGIDEQFALSRMEQEAKR